MLLVNEGILKVGLLQRVGIVCRVSPDSRQLFPGPGIPNAEELVKLESVNLLATSKMGSGSQSSMVRFSASLDGIFFSMGNVTSSPGRTSWGGWRKLKQKG